MTVRSLLPTALVLGLLACGAQKAETPSSPPARPEALQAATVPWSWHPLGSLAVVEGELPEPTELVLEGRSIRATRHAGPGPVRWEFFRPPEGEAAVLRTASGRELARFHFATEAAPRLAQAPARTLRPKMDRERPVTAHPPRQEAPEPPRAAAVARLRSTPVPPLPGRRPSELPHDPTRPPSPRVQDPAQPILPVPPPNEAVRPLGQPWPGMGEALNLTRGPAGRKRLLLSFDGGSNSEVAAEILDTLKAREVRTTIFLTGAFIQRFPDLVRRMAAEGHELGNHTMNHPHLAPGMKRDPKWTRERVQRELLEADEALLRLLGRPMDPFWRAPYGEHTAEIRRWAEELGYRHIGWSEGADTLDWATPKERGLYRSGDAILRRLQSRLDRDGDGLIVLMHLGSERLEGDRPSAGLGAFMDRARRHGWSFVPVGTFLHDLGKPAWDPQRRMALLQPRGSAAPAR